MKIQIFRFVTPCILANLYRRFERSSAFTFRFTQSKNKSLLGRFILQINQKLLSKRREQYASFYGLLKHKDNLWKRRKLYTSRHGVTTQKNWIFNNIVGKLEYRYKNHCSHCHYYLRSRTGQRLWPLSCEFHRSVKIYVVP